MLIAGLDLGSATGKAVIMNESGILGRSVIKSTAKPEKTALTVLNNALEQAGIKDISELDYIMGTGYGRTRVSFIQENMSEISCHARGAHWFHPETGTVIDVGGQDCKAIAVTNSGRVAEFVMNDKCAAGTGKFFEAMARTLDCSLEEFSRLTLSSENPCAITKQCSVFAESEVVTLINDGAEASDIAAGLTDSIVRRLLSMVYRVGVKSDIVFTGGCAGNEGLICGLEKKLDLKIIRLKEPQIAGAVGAALFGIERAAKAYDGVNDENI